LPICGSTPPSRITSSAWGLLASGAAHELGTPLASLSVILNDWRRMTAISADPGAGGRLHRRWRAAVQRCKSIVTDILVSAGAGARRRLGPDDLEGVPEQSRCRVERRALGAHLMFRNEFGSDPAIVSDVALKQAIVNVLDNAFEVSREWVELVAERDGDQLLLSVSDRGPGFDRCDAGAARPSLSVEQGAPRPRPRPVPGGQCDPQARRAAQSAWNHRGRGATVRAVSAAVDACDWRAQWRLNALF
jgi:two-component system sensor histidine kinase RegB